MKKLVAATLGGVGTYLAVELVVRDSLRKSGRGRANDQAVADAVGPTPFLLGILGAVVGYNMGK